MIADEPTTALDVTIQAPILKLLKDIQKRRELSILFITHDMGVVAQMADKIAVMRYGEIIVGGGERESFSKSRASLHQRTIKECNTTESSKRGERKR